MKRIKFQKAFTLIEVIAAVSLLALALLGILQGQSGSVQSIVRSEAMAQAYLLAQQKMTELEIEVSRTNFEAIDEERTGRFEEPGLENFRWIQRLEFVEAGCFIPAPPEGAEGSGAQSAGYFGAIEDIIQQHVRRLSVEVIWEGSNRPLRANLSQLFVRFADIPRFRLN
ncbi:MAG: prepilin-type N-terminal cleavage/methylation domain-containing protein [Bradymonadales bacterium]|nr:MAG: prepilin-type N-terminal cleavage/methylation domain-containing protein [Bradymonadales bacterium]